MATIDGYLVALNAMTPPPWHYDNRVPERCDPNGHGRDCSTFVAYGLINAGFGGVNACENSFGFAEMCFEQPRPAWFSTKFGSGQGTFISYEQAQTVVCWGFRGSNWGRSPDASSDGHIETLLGIGESSVGAHSHATGIGYDPDGIDNHNLSFFAVPPMFLAEMAPAPVDWNYLAKLAKWKTAVTKKPLVYGNVNANVQILNDLLHAKGLLIKSGNRYGKATQQAVHHFKLARHLPNSDGTRFGGIAAEAILT